MSKYIDAEKLKAEIERRKCNAELGKIEAQGISSLNYNIHLAEENLCLKLLNFIDAIPEQPVGGLEDEEKIGNFFDAIGDCGFSIDDILLLKSIWENACGAGKEQPAEGLEDEVKKYWNAHALDYRIGRIADLDFLFLCARHFAEWGAEHLKK